MKAGIDHWKDWDFTCKKCGWAGKGSSLEQGEMSWEGCEELCPSCHEMIEWQEFPLASDMLANSDKLTPEDLAMAQAITRGHNQWETSKLKSVEQLPDIETGYIALLWDEDDRTREIVIRHGREEIFRQKGSWEYYNFFIAACRILKKKYGYRLLDVVPTPAAWGSIHGDSLCASNSTEEMRRLIGADCYEPIEKNEFYNPSHEIKRREAWENFHKQYDD